MPPSRHIKKISRVEQLENRQVFASLSGSVWTDVNSNGAIDSGDRPVASAIVWIDSNRNGTRDTDEPATRTAASGGYAFENLSAGDYHVRMQPPPGQFQTSPAEYFAFYHGDQPNAFGLANVDIDTGAVNQVSPALAAGLRHGVIKTIQGEYYGAGHSTDSLFQINPITGAHTKIGYTGKELVAGLAYDPIMDKIYTLGRDTDEGFPELNLYEVDRTTAALTRVGSGDGISNIRATSGVTFDTVHREVVLFDNNLNEIIAYDLNGQGRKIFQFPESAAFYNLAFDGHRLLTFHTDEQNVTRLYEIDIEQQKLVELRTLQSGLAVDAADILGVNQALKVQIAADDSEIADAAFLTNQMELPNSTLAISADNLKLTAEHGLEINFPLDSAGGPVLFCVATQPSQLNIKSNSAQNSSVSVQMSSGDDRAVLDSAPSFQLQMGEGRDTLAFVGPVQLDLAALSGQVTGAEVIDLSQASASKLTVHSAALRSFNSSQSLTVVIASDDQLELNDRPWRAEPTGLSTLGGQPRRSHQLTVDDALLELLDNTAWRNPLLAEDVNRDGVISPIDALLVINQLNSGGGRQLSEGNSVDVSLEYVDPNGDNQLSPLDALLVISRLNEVVM